MNRNLISDETLKTIGQGALGAISFGACTQYNSNKMIEFETQYKFYINEMEILHKKQINEMEILHKQQMNEKKKRKYIFWK